ncbi:MAG: cupin domain-containing protein, partial [Gammaproteobacteria bacterium]
MLVKRTKDCAPFAAVDGCMLRELLHPAHGDCMLPYSLAIAEVAVGGKTHPLRLDRVEVYLILQGEARLHVDAETARLAVGAAALIPAHGVQWIENLGP